MSTTTATRIIGHSWELLPQRQGWRLLIAGDDGTAGCLNIRYIGHSLMAQIITDEGARELLHLIDPAQLLAKINRRSA